MTDRAIPSLSRGSLLQRFLGTPQAGLLLVIAALGATLAFFAGSHPDPVTGASVNNFLNGYTLMQIGSGDAEVRAVVLEIHIRDFGGVVVVLEPRQRGGKGAAEIHIRIQRLCGHGREKGFLALEEMSVTKTVVHFHG